MRIELWIRWSMKYHWPLNINLFFLSFDPFSKCLKSRSCRYLQYVQKVPKLNFSEEYASGSFVIELCLYKYKFYFALRIFYLSVTRNVIRLSYRFTNCKIGVFEGKWPKSYCLTAAKNFCVSRLYTRIFHHNPASLLAKHFGYHWMKHSAAYSWSGGGALIVIEFKIYFHLQSAVVDNFSVFKLYFHRLRPLYLIGNSISSTSSDCT